MPKFLSYQRPVPVNKGNWNGALKQKPPLPRKTPAAKPEAPISVPKLEEIVGKH